MNWPILKIFNLTNYFIYFLSCQTNEMQPDLLKNENPEMIVTGPDTHLLGGNYYHVVLCFYRLNLKVGAFNK